MITQQQAEKIAEQYCKENGGNAFEFQAVVYGITVAVSEIQPQVNALWDEVSALRDALNTAKMRIENGYPKSALSAINEVLNK